MNNPTEDPNSPYFLHYSHSLSASLVTLVLDGSNYESWSRSMLIAFSAKNKTAFVDGSLPRPQNGGSVLENAWIRNNNVVISWILNSTSKDISASLIYVDDMLVASSDLRQINLVKKELKSKFEMKDLGEASRILGIDLHRDKEQGVMLMSQESYLKKILEKYGMAECKGSSIPMDMGAKLSIDDCPKNEEEEDLMERKPYASIVGSLMYSMVSIRPDLAYPLSVLSRFMARPGEKHWNALKMVLRYVKDTLGYGLKYIKVKEACEDGILIGYSDSDFGKCLDTRKSLSGYCFTLYGNVISWRSHLQQVVALSTTEAEFMAATESVKEALWLQGLLENWEKLQGLPVFNRIARVLYT